MSRTTGHKWVRRYRDEGEAGLLDRGSRPHPCHAPVPDRTEQRIDHPAATHPAPGPRLDGILGLHASTVHGS
ncbi:leucine zipper domain-containing protein [Amycolatopsis sp. FDAARGOS 1241]|uniref:helix-turn-helix domain-containing protein n=1 Tax=Amycolatopsis sp. FDAARGOS 1241 TaxID=2778070 RepID=UPI00195151B1|nr:helix-turn-helix domain-containing protein [Amycolatopsis sp. FDAARGOS 1241]